MSRYSLFCVYKNSNRVIFLFLGLVGIYLILMLLDFIRAMLIIVMSKKIDQKIYLIFLNRVLELPIKFFEEKNLGEIISRFNSILGLEEIISRVTLSVMLDCFMAIFGGIILIKISYKLFYIVLGIVALYAVIVLAYRKILKRYVYKIMESDAKLTAEFKEIMDGYETIKCLNVEEKFYIKISQRVEELLAVSAKFKTKGSMQNNLLNGVQNIGNLGILCLGSCLVIKGCMTLGTFISFQSLLRYFIGPVQDMIQLQPELQQTIGVINRLNDIILAEREDVHEESSNYEFDSIRFDNVTFRYEESQTLLEKVSFTINKGEKVAIVGKNGCGKSTILKLIYGFYKASQGKIMLGSFCIEELNLKTLRENISFISQKDHLFYGTIKENLLMGISEMPEKQNYVSILKVCGIDLIEKRLPYGLDTMVGEGGDTLSLGEQQRVAMARVLLKNPPVLIIDEGTSNIDSATEVNIYDFIWTYFPDTTVIFINHRMNFLNKCDKYIEILEGKANVCEKK